MTGDDMGTLDEALSAPAEIQAVWRLLHNDAWKPIPGHPDMEAEAMLDKRDCVHFREAQRLVEALRKSGFQLTQIREAA